MMRLPTGLLLAPYLIGTGLLVLLPALMTFGVAFTSYDLWTAPVWVGGQNFADLAGYVPFQAAVRNSLFFVLLAVPLRVLGALALALLLHPRRGFGVYRAAVYLPTVVPDVANALVWLWVLNPVSGPLNLLLGSLGLPTPAWLVRQEAALPGLAIMAAFQLGEGFVMLLAGRSQIPRDCYESAALDGANPWQQFLWITLPLLLPWLVLLTIRDVVASTQNVFTAAYLMTGGGPHMATLFVPQLVIEEAFDRLRVGRAAAALVVQLAVTGLLLLPVYALVRRWETSND